MDKYIDAAWTTIKAAFLGLGGIAGIMKIYDLLTSGAKLKTFWLKDISTDMNRDDGTLIGTLLLILIDVVNLRQHPVCIRNWDLELHSEGRKFIASRWYIPPGFKTPAAIGATDISKEQLTEKSFHNPIEYGKAMRGWLAFWLPEVKNESFSKSEFHYVFIIEDAFGKIHKVKCERPKPVPDKGTAFYVGAGQDANIGPRINFDFGGSKSKPKT
jgi:hypothetical protein